MNKMREREGIKREDQRKEQTEGRQREGENVNCDDFKVGTHTWREREKIKRQRGKRGGRERGSVENIIQ